MSGVVSVLRSLSNLLGYDDMSVVVFALRFHLFETIVHMLWLFIFSANAAVKNDEGMAGNPKSLMSALGQKQT